MFLDYLHGAYDTRLFTVGVVEEGQLTLLHRPQIITRSIRADAWHHMCVNIKYVY
jgi:hypothetical protein